VSAVALLLVLSLGAIPCQGAAAPSHQVELGNALWKIRIDAQRLAVSARPTGMAGMLVSAPQMDLGPVTRLEQGAQQARWELPGKKLTVSVRLAGSTLLVSLQSSEVGQVTWPVIEPQAALRGYLLPTFEGRYVPAHDAIWSRYLADQGEMSTTEGLSLPLWGLDGGDYTLTYLLTNPLNNSLTFQDRGGSLGCRLTHQFTRHHPAKQYGLRIILGAASPLEPARQYRRWLIATGQFVEMKEKIKHVPAADRLLGAPHVYLQGDGVSPEMMEELAGAGLDRLLLVVDGWQALRDSPEAVRRAKALGFLIAPYDSYNSIHSPDAARDETWETAQFDRKLYETGAIVRWDGKKRAGFLHKGYLLSPLVPASTSQAGVLSPLLRSPVSSPPLPGCLPRLGRDHGSPGSAAPEVQGPGRHPGAVVVAVQRAAALLPGPGRVCPAERVDQGAVWVFLTAAP
jgi:glycosyl hydrolase family 129